MAVTEPLLTVILLTIISGIAMPIGALIANVEHIKPNWLDEELKHGVIAFGGGALLSAVALVLIPQGITGQSLSSAAMYFCGGGFAFMAIDILLYRFNTPASQLAAMLSDFIPESLALGAAIAIGNTGAFLLAGLMTLQNIPEGFNAYRELKDSSNYSAMKIITLFGLMSLIGPISGVSGFLYLADKPDAVSAIMLFASGGILYSVFQDIAPQAKLEKHWLPAMGAILGFMLGLLGHMISEN